MATTIKAIAEQTTGTTQQVGRFGKAREREREAGRIKEDNEKTKEVKSYKSKTFCE